MTAELAWLWKARGIVSRTGEIEVVPSTVEP